MRMRGGSAGESRNCVQGSAGNARSRDRAGQCDGAAKRWLSQPRNAAPVLHPPWRSGARRDGGSRRADANHRSPGAPPPADQARRREPAGWRARVASAPRWYIEFSAKEEKPGGLRAGLRYHRCITQSSYCPSRRNRPGERHAHSFIEQPILSVGSSARPKPLRIAIFGFGTVGSSVARILVESKPEGLELTHVFNRNVARKRAGLGSCRRGVERGCGCGAGSRMWT